jgi:hypothetical protein
MTREDLAARLGALALMLFPSGAEGHDLSLDELEGARLRTIAIFAEAEHQVRRDAELTAEDVADDILQQEQDERESEGVGRD